MRRCTLLFSSSSQSAQKLMFIEVWREYIDVEGLDLTPQLVTPNKGLEETQALLLVDENLTTCVEVKPCGNKGNLLIYAGRANCALEVPTPGDTKLLFGHFFQNCMKINNFWQGEGHASLANPLGSATGNVISTTSSFRSKSRTFSAF